MHERKNLRSRTCKMEEKNAEGSFLGESSHVNTNSSLEYSLSYPQSPRLALINETVDTDHQEGMDVNDSGTPGSQDVPDDTSFDQHTLISSKISVESGTGVEDATPSNPLSHLLDTSIEELDVVPNHVEDRSLATALTSDELKETGDSLSMSPNELHSPKLEVRTVRTKVRESAESSEHVQQVDVKRVLIDTAAPFESVKEAVSKFGETVDWKAHKEQILERRKQIQYELEKVQSEIPKYKKKSEVAEDAKAEVLRELDSTKRAIEELKLGLERVETEEVQAKQDSELAQLRMKEVEQGIAKDVSVAAKTQFEVSKARHEAAVAELNSVKEELEALRGQYDSLLTERDIAIRKAEEARSSSKEMEKTVEDLTLEFITAKKSLESAQTSHLEAEEQRIAASLAREQDFLNWEKELKLAEEEEHRLTEQLLLGKDLKAKLDTASALLRDLKAELASYMESKLNQESDTIVEETKKELEEVKANIGKARDEVTCLRLAESALKLELDREKEALTTIRQREGMAHLSVASLEAEINRTKQEVELVLAKEIEVREKTVELPKLLQQAAQEAEQAKSVTELAREELRKAKEESELAKAGASTMEIRLLAALKEIEASEASKQLALAAVAALQESEESIGLEGVDSPRGVTLALEEYYKLSKQAHEAEELANERVTIAIAQIEAAKESEMRSLERLEEAHKEMDEKKEALRLASERAEKAQKGKLSVEQELRKWRAEHEQRRRANNAAQAASNPTTPKSYEDGCIDKEATPNLYMPRYKSETAVTETKVKKKKSLFPRIVMFLARKKAQSLK